MLLVQLMLQLLLLQLLLLQLLLLVQLMRLLVQLLLLLLQLLWLQLYNYTKFSNLQVSMDKTMAAHILNRTCVHAPPGTRCGQRISRSS